MTASVNNTFDPLEGSRKRYAAPFTTGDMRRMLANLYHLYVRITGDTTLPTPGLDGAHTVTGHGHTGATASITTSDGYPMPRTLGFMCSSRRSLRDTTASGQLVRAQLPVMVVSLAQAHVSGSGAHAASSEWFSICKNDGFLGVTANLAPAFRRVQVSPGINWVGALVEYMVIAHTDDAIYDAGKIAGYMRLTSSPSSSGDLDGSASYDYEKANTGAQKTLRAEASDTGSVRAITTPAQPYNNVEFGTMQRVWLGLPWRLLPTGSAPTTATRNGAAGHEVPSLATVVNGAVPVSPGALNDIDIEVRGNFTNQLVMIYKVMLFEIALGSGAAGV